MGAAPRLRTRQSYATVAAQWSAKASAERLAFGFGEAWKLGLRRMELVQAAGRVEAVGRDGVAHFVTVEIDRLTVDCRRLSRGGGLVGRGEDDVAGTDRSCRGDTGV